MNKSSTSSELQAFSFWLRTGRRLPMRNAASVEVKFNHWHDPSDGRFTFSNSGTYHGFRGGGGRFGGGGASGSWSAPTTARKKVPPVVAKRQGEPTGGSSAGKPMSPIRRGATESAPFRSIVRNGYEYQIDPGGRTRRVSGTLTMSVQARSRSAQAAAGGIDRKPSDDGGHYIAARFNGPRDAFNHFAQDSNINRGRYRALEDQWAREKRAGRGVIVNIVPNFEGGSARPTAIDVKFTINGKLESVKIPNSRQGK